MHGVNYRDYLPLLNVGKNNFSESYWIAEIILTLSSLNY